MADDTPDTTPESAPAESSDDVSYLRAELKKIASQRDKAKADAKALRDQAQLTTEERSKLESFQQAAADAEEQKRLAAGEYEAAKSAILKEKADAEAKAKAADDRYRRKVVETAFAAATDLFGPSGLTTLTADFAYAGMSSHVELVPGKDGAPDRMVVRDLNGEIIRSEGGDPAPFAEGMRALIEMWPGKENILRAGQRAGSGSTGGSGEAATPADRAQLAERAWAGDRQAAATLRRSQPQGRTIRGRFWEDQAQKTDAS